MTRLACLLIVGAMSLWSGCGEDDGTNPPPTGAPRLIASHPGSSPSLVDVDDALWGAAASTSVDLSYQNPLKSAAAKPAAAADSAYLKAIVRNDTLYVRALWSDATNNVWLDHYETIDLSPLNFTRDCCGDAAAEREDEFFAMFAGLPGGAYDVWNWRALTTDAGRLAEGMTFSDGSLNADSSSLSAKPAINHPPLGGTMQPSYMAPDSSEFHGYILYNTEAVPFKPTSGGWTLGQRIPGWLIDSTVYSRSAELRMGRWAIRATSDYDSSASMYTVMMCRPMSTGFADDLDLAALDSVKMKIVVLNNQVDLATGSSNRGISEEFWLIL